MLLAGELYMPNAIHIRGTCVIEWMDGKGKGAK